MNMDVKEFSELNKRETITKKAFKSLGLLPSNSINNW